MNKKTMLNQFTHERFIEFLHNATLSDIQAMAPENLPEGVDMGVLFEAPMDLSDAVRTLVLQAQALQSQNKEGNMLKALGARGEEILAIANAPTPSSIQQAFKKQQTAVRDLQIKLELKEDPIVKGVLNKLLVQLEQGSNQIQSQKKQIEQYLKDLETILQDQDQANLHTSVEHIKNKLKKQVESLNKDIESFGKGQESTAEQHIPQLKNKFKTLLLNVKKLDTHVPKPKNKKSPPKITQDIKQALALTIESFKNISHNSLTTHLNDLLSDLTLDPSTQEPEIKKRMNIALNLVQWYCSTNEAIIDLERKARILSKEDPFIDNQISKQQEVLHTLEQILKNSTHFHLSAVQAKQAWTDELKAVR